MPDVVAEPTEQGSVAQVAPEAPVDEDLYDRDRALAKIAKVNSEAKGLRDRVKELEAYEAKVREIEDSQKSEQQRLIDRAEAAERDGETLRNDLIRERVARKYQIADEDFDFLGSGSEEQITARAERLAAKNAAAQPAAVPPVPRTDRPIERLRPGATPSSVDIAEPDAYPAHWRPRPAPKT